MSDGDLVTLLLLPPFESSIPKQMSYTAEDLVILYRKKANFFARLFKDDSDTEPKSRINKAVRISRKLVEICVWRDLFQADEIRTLDVQDPPRLKVLWANAGCSVAVILNDEPWAFINGEDHRGYSKGVRRAGFDCPWNQALFEKIFVKSD